jgi:SEC-C motif-containing protein
MKHCPTNAPCPCGQRRGQGNTKAQPLSYGNCCGRYLDGDIPAPDAQALMRSRYCAFVLERARYLLTTWHASHRPALIEFEAGVKWLGLEVRHFQPPTSEHPDAAEVEFVARQKPASGAAVRLHERSRFVSEGGRWFYLYGVLHPD